MRDRYLTYRERNGYKRQSHTLIKVLVALVMICSFIMIVLSAAHHGTSLHPPSVGDGDIGQFISNMHHFIVKVDRLYEVVLIFRALGTFLLVPLAIVAKRRVGRESVCLHAINITAHINELSH